MSWLAEAHYEYPFQVGRYYTDRAWLLSPLDVWQRNPWYDGPPVHTHPEDHEEILSDIQHEESHWEILLNRAEEMY